MMTEVMERSKVELRTFETGGTTRTRVGNLLMRKGWKAADWQRRWDRNRDGTVDRHEVVRALRDLGVDATEEQLGEFFDEHLDRNQDGVMDLDEAREAFKVFKRDAASWEAERSQLRAKVAVHKRGAKEAQMELDQQMTQANKKLAEAEVKVKQASSSAGGGWWSGGAIIV